MKKLFSTLFFVFLVAFGVLPSYSTPIDIEYENGVYHIRVTGGQRTMKKKVKVYASQDLMTNAEMHAKSKAELTVNAGFFDPKTGKTISYVATGRNTLEDPRFTDSLYSDFVLRRNLSKILNRTEFRIVDCNGKYKYEIVPHNSSVDFTCDIVEAVQGGPLIIPELRLEEEFFILKNGDEVVRESCSVLHKVPRTVVGIKGDELHFLIITDESPMDMYEVQELCKKYGFDRAMGLDGGSSTSMNYKKQYNVVSVKGDGAGRRLKSFIIVKP